MPLSLVRRSRNVKPKSRLLQRFRRADTGALAVEFGLIAPFFLGLLFGILEVALTFWSAAAVMFVPYGETTTSTLSRSRSFE